MSEARTAFEKKLKQVAGNADFLLSEHMNLRGQMLTYFTHLKRQLNEAEALYMELLKDPSEDPEVIQSTSDSKRAEFINKVL
jgi:hypothetical protein